VPIQKSNYCQFISNRSNLIDDPPHLSEQDDLVAPLVVDLHVEMIVVTDGVVNAADGAVARRFKKTSAGVFDAATVLAGEEP